MKIIIVGASGRFGKEVDKALSVSHDIVRVYSNKGPSASTLTAETESQK